MSTTKSNIKLTLGYKDTDFTRQYKFDNVTDDAISELKGKVIAFNESISGGNGGGVDNFFISDDFDASEGIGKTTGIKAAQYSTESVTEIVLN